MKKQQHSRFAPSKMHRRIECPGSAHIDNKNIQSEFAKEGIIAHEIAAYTLQNTKSKIILSPHNISLTDEMADNLYIYTEYIQSFDFPKYIETEVKLSSISDEIFGTADCIIVDWPERLHIIDLKYGKGKLEEPTNNPQLITYALAALERFGDDFDNIQITIIQPRIDHKNGPIRHWISTTKELKKNWYSKIKKAYEDAIKKPKLYKSGDHCMWCSGAFECSKAKNTTKIIKKEEKITTDNKELAKLLKSEKMILEYFNKAKNEAFQRLLKGERIPGFKLVKSFGNTIWKDEKKAKKHFNEDAYFCRLLSPTQLKKTKFYTKELIDSLSYRPEKGLILVPENDRRSKYENAIEDFKEK